VAFGYLFFFFIPVGDAPRTCVFYDLPAFSQRCGFFSINNRSKVIYDNGIFQDAIRSDFAWRIQAVSASVTEKVPDHGVDRIVMFCEAYKAIGIPVKVNGVLICAILPGLSGRKLVPLLACDLATPACDAARGVYQKELSRHDF
jgi:hypothetical protein